MACPSVYLGLDFSGDARRWSAGCRRSNVWLARVEDLADGVPFVRALHRVQNLAGSGPPFERLVCFLRKTQFAAAGIDAPFSVPAPFLPGGSYAALLELAARIGCGKRPFPTGGDLVSALRAAATAPSPTSPKPLRETERFWAGQGVNVRSTMWNGARGGAPMAAACLTLLARAGLPVWPWTSGSPRLLVEAFPAAQLRAWRLPHQGYNDPRPGALETRMTIVDGIRSRTGLVMPAAVEAVALASADALDAVVCAFAAKAVLDSALPDPPEPISAAEGWIAVHR